MGIGSRHEWYARAATGTCARPQGFTLLELLVVIALVSTLASLLLPALSGARQRSRVIQCLSQMRQLSIAVGLYADDHADEFPRSQHSAFAHGVSPWGRSVAPYLGAASASWTNLLRGVYRCPADRRSTPWSYGLNVYFELGAEDDYTGKPLAWRRLGDVPHPADTVLYTGNETQADHVMAHFWGSAADRVELPLRRHGRRVSAVFVDGHAVSRDPDLLFDPSRGVDAWHP